MLIVEGSEHEDDEEGFAGLDMAACAALECEI
jgi:hypothetical protein